MGPPGTKGPRDFETVIQGDIYDEGPERCDGCILDEYKAQQADVPKTHKKIRKGTYMHTLLRILMSVMAMLVCNAGEGNTPSAPTYSPSPATTALGTTLDSTLQGLLNTPYSSLVSEFTPSASSTQTLDQATQDFTNMINSTSFSTADNTAAENAYLNSTVQQYNTSRGQQQAQLNQSLAANNLIGSGPGYQQQEQFNQDTATGVGNLTAAQGQWDITNQEQQTAYEQALESGDYSTLYALGQSNAQESLQPTLDAQTALDNYLSSGQTQFSSQTSADLNQYNAALQAYQLDQSDQSNLGGIGSLLGTGLGALALGPLGLVPGVGPLAGAVVGSLLGGSVGSSFAL